MARQNKPKQKRESHTNGPKDIEKQITITVEEQASIHSYLRITELPWKMYVSVYAFGEKASWSWMITHTHTQKGLPLGLVGIRLN